MTPRSFIAAEFHLPPLISSDFIHAGNKEVSILDIGCGFGGLTIALSKLFPEKLVLGMEIRAKVCEYVRLRIEALRKEEPGHYQNASCLRTNCMRYLPNFFRKGQIEMIFIAFPDPHFKAKNHRRRIVSDVLLSEYAYFLQPNGRLYMITDVEELHYWHVEKCNAHPCFERLTDEELEDDPRVPAMYDETEESKKVARMNGVPTPASSAVKRYAVYRRLSDFEVRHTAIQDLFT